MLIQSTRRPSALQVGASTSADPQKVEHQAAETTETQGQDSVGPLSGESGQRVGHFVRGVALESLQHLRYLSAANAFQNVGSALGSVAITPLAIHVTNENAALVGGLGIGGTIAAGAIGAIAGYAWLYRKDGREEGKAQEYSKAADTALNIGTTLQALPKFIYPTVVGATDAQRELVYDALDRLPLHQATASATMEVVPDLVDTGISGMAQPGASHVHILLDQSYMNNPDWGTELVIHEQAHAVDYAGGFGLLGAHNWKAGFGKAPFVSNYAGSNRYEDFAESFEAYYDDPETFTQNFPEKAAAIEKISHPDMLSNAIDTPEVRKAGRRAGEALGKVPYLRTGLALAGSLVAPIQVHRGASKLTEALQSGDKSQELDGKLNLASGLFLTLPGTRPLGLVTSIAGTAIRATSKDDNGAHLEQANRWANGVLTASAGPVGMAVAAMSKELNANGMSLDASTGFAPEGWKSARPGKGAMLKGTLSTVGGTVAGAVLGAAAGGAVSGPAGAMLGALWGQVAGGAIGLAGYSVHRVMSHKSDDGDPLALTKGEKKFLKGMIGGAVVGGAAGTVGGALLGRTVGSLVGQAVGGPGVASVMSSMGGWVGGLGGAFGGAKLGAGVGSGRLLGRREESSQDESWKQHIN